MSCIQQRSEPQIDLYTLKPSIVKLHNKTHTHTRCSVPVARRGGGRCVAGGGSRGRGFAVCFQKFHYPMDADLPPSQRGLVLYMFSTFPPHKKVSPSSLLFARGSCRDRLLESGAGDYRDITDGGGRGLILIFQCGSEDCALRRYGKRSCLQIKSDFPLEHSGKTRPIHQMYRA